MRLSLFIEQFAKASKIEKVIQGDDNNDLEIFKLTKVDGKLGGTNRATGYYLEAERDEDEWNEDDEGGDNDEDEEDEEEDDLEDWEEDDY